MWALSLGTVTVVGVDPGEPALICRRFSVCMTVGHGSASWGARAGNLQEEAPGAKEWEAGTGCLALLWGPRVWRGDSPASGPMSPA